MKSLRTERRHPARLGALQVVTSTQRRGAEVFALGLESALASRGRSVRTIALAPGPPDHESLQVPVLGPKPLASSTVLRLRHHMVSSAVTIAHGSNTLPACALAATGTGARFVYRNIGDPLYWSGRLDRRARVSLFLHRARAVAVLWPGAADSLMARYGVAAAKIRVIPNGVPAGQFPKVGEEERAAARERLGIDVGAPVVVYLGSLSPEKDVGAAVRAMGPLADAQLVVAGDGVERPALEALARSEAPGRVRFLGVVDEPSLVLAASDVVVLPSRTEGLPAALIEAGMSGLPVVATCVGGIAEIVVHEETGLLVPPGDVGALSAALRRALSDGGPFGMAARARCLAHFEMGVVAAAWDDLLDDVAEW